MLYSIILHVAALLIMLVALRRSYTDCKWYYESGARDVDRMNGNPTQKFYFLPMALFAIVQLVWLIYLVINFVRQS